MAGGATHGARELDRTPTWAVSAVCAGIIVISIILEKVLHLIGEFFQERKKKALFEALEKVKNELMVLGFISLLLTFGQNYISKFCIPTRFADTMLPCPPHDHPAADLHEYGNVPSGGKEEHHRRLLWFERRSLAGGAPSVGCKEGHLPLISVNGLHQLHIFIFFLAVFHVIYSCITMGLGKLKIRGWKDWEKETMRNHEMMNDPARFRLTHETSFVKGHNSFWTKTPALFYIVCFLRQFSRSVRRADYLTMRHGFISVHLAPGSKFDFQKYIKRSLEDDFKVVVGISPLLWASVVLFLLVNVDGWQAMLWISILPLVVTLAVGTKLQAIIAQMALEIQEKHAVVQGIPLVQVSDRHFWFSWPPLVLYLIHFVLFQNAFEITYFFWIWYEFGLESCFHSNFTYVIVRVCLGIGAQFLCSYSTLPLYALVTQMGSTMKRSVFDEQTSKALKQWHQKAAKKKTEEGSEMRTRVLGGSPGDSLVNSPANHRRPNSTNVGVELSDIDAHTTSPHRTANIVASVDLHGDQQRQRNDNNGFPDLLSGP
ncbi:MLO-like protein 9 [Tripterygium wilfordii]|uniref:MLO-like protein 9 n=1 Tax=Tripterygium wilfordii TaxID=458696 RepID=UPI0018F80253|nr:MLO-like protein 9 [Tripterygium wilfordii]